MAEDDSQNGLRQLVAHILTSKVDLYVASLIARYVKFRCMIGDDSSAAPPANSFDKILWLTHNERSSST